MQVKTKRRFIGRFAYQTDLLGALTDHARTHRITLGTFQVIGAVTRATMGYYDQGNRRYVTCVDLEKKLEIVSCTGNISLSNGDVFVHAHITLADHAGATYGGHLMPGTVIFAAEYLIDELSGAALRREHDPQTGLCLWKDPPS